MPSSSKTAYTPVNRIRRFAVAAVVVDTSLADRLPSLPGADGQVRVAAVNIGRLIRERTGMRQSLKELRSRQQIIDESMAAERRQLDQERGQLARLEAGSAAYRVLENVLACREADLEARAELARRDFRQREARIYTSTYDSVVEGVRRCTQHLETGIVHHFDRRDAGESQADAGLGSILERIEQAITCQ